MSEMFAIQPWHVHRNYEGHVSLEMMNKAFGDKGRTFSTEDEARLYAAKHKIAWVTPITNYNFNDVECVGKLSERARVVKPRPGAKKKIIAWLVSTAVPPGYTALHARG